MLTVCLSDTVRQIRAEVRAQIRSSEKSLEKPVRRTEKKDSAAVPRQSRRKVS
jgi:hypothetical protein